MLSCRKCLVSVGVGVVWGRVCGYVGGWVGEYVLRRVNVRGKSCVIYYTRRQNVGAAQYQSLSGKTP